MAAKSGGSLVLRQSTCNALGPVKELSTRLEENRDVGRREPPEVVHRTHSPSEELAIEEDAEQGDQSADARNDRLDPEIGKGLDASLVRAMRQVEHLERLR